LARGSGSFLFSRDFRGKNLSWCRSRIVRKRFTDLRNGAFIQGSQSNPSAQAPNPSAAHAATKKVSHAEAQRRREVSGLSLLNSLRLCASA
jgi:hypothetical protein